MRIDSPPRLLAARAPAPDAPRLDRMLYLRANFQLVSFPAVLLGTVAIFTHLILLGLVVLGAYALSAMWLIWLHTQIRRERRRNS